jgi:outer membrane protein insertion porin family
LHSLRNIVKGQAENPGTGAALATALEGFMAYRFVMVVLWALAISVTGPAVFQFSQSAQAQTVGQIVVEGTQRVETDTVLSYMQISRGDPFDAERIDESVKALFQTGLFSDVQVFRRGSSLVVRVVENPQINSVKFTGNDEIDEDDLAKETELRERMVYTPARVQSDIERINAVYRRAGFQNVRVVPRTVQLPQNRIDLTYEITEGIETRIGDIEFVGNEAFSDGDLRSVISSARYAWWKFFSKNDKYDPDRLEYDKELLRRHYLKNGFADFKVISADAVLQPDGENYIVTFTVEEGPLYRVGDVSVNRGQTPLDEGGLQTAVVTSPGEDFDASKVDKSVENITIEAGKAGYAFAKVEPDIQRDPANRILNIVYNINEGPRTYVERIDIVGNSRTRDDVIRRELRIFEGDAYNRVLIDRARRRLTALDFFEKIDFREEAGSAPDKVALIVEVVEKSTGSINFSIGYSTAEAVVGGISVSERNLMGKGQNVRLATQLSWKRQQIDFSFTEPYFMGMPISAGFDAFATRSDNQEFSSYTIDQIGGALRTGFRLDEWQSLNFKYSFSRRDIFDVDEDASLAIRDSEGITYKSMVSATYTYDDLDNPLKPTKGFRAQLTGDLAGLGGDVYYASAEASAFWFQPLITDGIVLKLEGNVGHMEGLFGEDVPIQDRFFKGGDTFRGFARSGVGPRMLNGNSGNVDAIGGQTYALGTVEVTFPLGLPEEFGIEGAVFSDFGTVFDAPESTISAGAAGCTGTRDCRVFDTAAFRASIGAGLIWQSPFGPLRFDLAYPILKADYDDTEYFRFSIGTRF